MPLEGDDDRPSRNFQKIAGQLQEMKYGTACTFSEFLRSLGFSQEEYILALRSSLKTDEIFLKRSPAEIRINNYNPLMLKCWEANLDIQFVLDAYACAAYIVSYISKGQRGMSQLLHQACKEARAGNDDIKQQVRRIGNNFLTHVEISAQEASYLVLQMPLKRASRSVIFISTAPPDERTFLVKPTAALEAMAADSTDIESDNMLKRYQRRPHSLQTWCLADFVSWLDMRVSATSHSTKTVFSCFVELAETEYVENLEDTPQDDMSGDLSSDLLQKEFVLRDGTVLFRRKTQKIIRYVRYSKVHDSENYYREQLMLYTPWRKEPDDILGGFNTYEDRFNSCSELLQQKR